MSHFCVLTCKPFVTSVLIAFQLAYLMQVNGVSLCFHLHLRHSFGIKTITFARVKPWGHCFHSDIVYILYKQMPWQYHDYIPVHFVAQNTWYWLNIRRIIIYKVSHVTTRRKFKIIKNNITNNKIKHLYFLHARLAVKNLNWYKIDNVCCCFVVSF
jgi:hypothetical protein